MNGEMFSKAIKMQIPNSNPPVTDSYTLSFLPIRLNSFEDRVYITTTHLYSQ